MAFFLKEKNGGYAKCNIFNKIFKTGGGSTSALHTHAKTIHLLNTLKRASASVVSETSAIGETVAGSSSSSQITKYFKTVNETSLEKILAEMCAYDGISFKVFITSEFLRQSI